MAIGDLANNPGDLLAGPSWQGQVGTISGNGLSYAQFSTTAYGVRALAIDLKNAIADGYNTVSSLVYHFLGTSSNNAANPNVSNYLSAVESGSGLSGSISTSDVPALVQGIIKGEGTSVSSSNLSEGLSMAGFGSVIPSSVGSSVNNVVTGIENLTGMQTNTASVSTGETPQKPNTSANPLTMLSDLIGELTSGSLWSRVALLIFGMLLLAAAVFALTRSSLEGSSMPVIIPA